MPITWLHCYGQERDLLDSFLLCRVVQHESFVLFIVGHGRSEGEPVQISSFDIYAADVLKHMDEKLVNHGGLPIFLFGHSMASFHPLLFNWKSSLEVIRWRRKEMGNFLVIEEVFSKNIIFSGHEKKYIGVYHPKWIVLLLHADWLVGKWIAFFGTLKEINSSFVICVVYTKTIIHLSVGKSGGYLPCCFRAR